jgi:hypothetical protein
MPEMPRGDARSRGVVARAKRGVVIVTKARGRATEDLMCDAKLSIVNLERSQLDSGRPWTIGKNETRDEKRKEQDRPGGRACDGATEKRKAGGLGRVSSSSDVELDINASCISN